jgi:hypothetical protein
VDGRPEPESDAGPELSRSDMRDIRGALRNDWPIPEPVRKALLQRLVDYCDREHIDGATAGPKTVIAAARTIAAFAGLSLKQQALDLAREKLGAGAGGAATTVVDAMKLVERVEGLLDGEQDPSGR